MRRSRRLKQGLKPPPWNESTLCWGPGREMGIEDVVGLDGPWTETEKLLIPKGLFHAIDLSSNIDLKRKFDLVISLEVGEHLEEETAPRFVGPAISSPSMRMPFRRTAFGRLIQKPQLSSLGMSIHNQRRPDNSTVTKMCCQSSFEGGPLTLERHSISRIHGLKPQADC